MQCRDATFCRITCRCTPSATRLPLGNVPLNACSRLNLPKSPWVYCVSSPARRYQSLNQIGQSLASGWSEPSCTHIALGRIVRVYAHGVVAHVKMMNRVTSTHSEGRTSSSGMCSAKNVEPQVRNEPLLSPPVPARNEIARG